MAKFNINPSDLLRQAAEEKKDEAINAIESIYIDGIGDMIESTPLGVPNSLRYGNQRKGNVRFNWQSGRTVNGRVLKGSSPKGKAFAERAIRGKLGKGRSVFIFNNHPAINTIEYGGYPSPVKVGTRLRGGGAEKRSSGGYSRQAPRGFIRVGVRRINARLRRLQRF